MEHSPYSRAARALNVGIRVWYWVWQLNRILRYLVLSWAVVASYLQGRLNWLLLGAALAVFVVCGLVREPLRWVAAKLSMPRPASWYLRKE